MGGVQAERIEIEVGIIRVRLREREVGLEVRETGGRVCGVRGVRSDGGRERSLWWRRGRGRGR